MVWKTVNNNDQGDANHFGGDDGDKWSNLYNGVLNVDTVKINSPFQFITSKAEFRNPADTFSYVIVSSAITANRNIVLPLAEEDDEILFCNAQNVKAIEQKTINSFSNLIHADTLHIPIRNESGAPISKGDLVYISGYSAPQDRYLVQLAKADVAGQMPAIGMVNDTSIPNNANGEAIVNGIVEGLNTNGFAVGDSIYVTTTAGQFGIKPTGASDLVQKIATVLRSDLTNGVIDIRGAGRSNATPNLADTYIFVGNATNEATPVPISNDASLANTGALTIVNDAITFAKMQNISSQNLIGRNAVGSGDPEELLPATVRSILNVADGANAYVHPNHTGEVTSTGDGAQVITDEAVTMAKIQHISQNEVLGRITASTGDVEVLTAAQLTTIPNTFTDSLKGLVPPSGGTTTFLQADGSWVDINPIGDHDIYLDAGGFVSVTSGQLATRIVGTAGNRKAFAYMEFVNGGDQYAVAKFKPPREWDKSTITAIIDWTTSTEGTGDVKWNLSACAVGDLESIDTVAFGTAVSVTDTQGTINQEQATPRTAALTVGNTPVDGDMIYIKIEREGAHASDTFDQPAQLLGMWITVTTDEPHSQ